MSEIQDDIQNLYHIWISNYRVNYTVLKVNVCLNVCLHFDLILKGSYMTFEAYIFLQYIFFVKILYLRWYPNGHFRNNKTISSLFVHYCCKKDTKIISHGSSKQMLFIYFKD